MCQLFNNVMPNLQDSHVTNRLLELHRKIRSKLCKEICGHILAVIVFSSLVIISIVETLKYKEPNIPKLTAAIVGICHFGLCTTAILHLKYSGIVEFNPLKCKIWIYFEVYNIAAITAFIVLATRHLLPPPFHQWTGTALLLIIYWFPLIMYKTSQICRMFEFVNVLSYLLDCSITPLSQHCYEESHGVANSNSVPPAASPSGTNPSVTNRTVKPIFPISKSLSSPHIPYEWALIDSITSAFP